MSFRKLVTILASISVVVCLLGTGVCLYGDTGFEDSIKHIDRLGDSPLPAPALGMKDWIPTFFTSAVQ